MTDATAKLEYAVKYLRRTYTLAELKTLATTIWETATDTVTLTSNSHEGGGASGQITFEKAILGMAIEQLIEEQDTDVVADVPNPVQHANFGCGAWRP